MKLGEITQFDVHAKCPHCENETTVYQSELKDEEAGCQHCDESFQVKLDADY
jgi:ribosomal protein S27E